MTPFLERVLAKEIWESLSSCGMVDTQVFLLAFIVVNINEYRETPTTKLYYQLTQGRKGY